MGFLDRLLGRTPTEQQRQQPTPGGSGGPGWAPQTGPSQPQAGEDERAVARYRYLLRTAPPEQLEALHAEAFAKLTAEQRQQLLRELAAAAPGEAGTSSEPADLARAATRAEMRRPGTLQSTFSRGTFGGGMGMGGMIAGSMMGTIAGVVLGSAIADSLFGGYDQSPEAQEAGDTGSDAGTDAGDSGGSTGDGSTDGSDTGTDAGFTDTGSTDAGGDWGGGDFGGGDFGGGDFGGGDFGGF